MLVLVLENGMDPPAARLLHEAKWRLPSHDHFAETRCANALSSAPPTRAIGCAPA